uniref:MADF domain-containing protein n=1 Tax=Anopheles minimus TaxID=112268 RepID=A0A182WB47_9DIPT
MELPEVEYRDEASNSSELMDLNENGNKVTIEFIKVENDEETTQYVEEFDSEEPIINDENNMDTDTDTEATMTKEEFAISLINSVREFSVLWKHTKHGYSDPKAGQDAWNKLSEKFGMPAALLRKKWKLLRQQFRTNRAKMRQMREFDKNYQPPWFAFDAMRYLKEASEGPETETAVEAIEIPVEESSNGCAENEPTCADEIDTQSVILELIEQVKHAPLLWDQSCLLYNNKNKQTEAWKKIAERMNLSVDEAEIKQSLPVTSTTKHPVPKKRVSSAAPVKRHVPSLVAFEPSLPTPVNVNQPLSNPITVKRIVSSTAHLPPTVEPTVRNCKRRFNGTTMNTTPKLLCRTPNSSSLVASKPVLVDLPSGSK